MRRGKRTNIDCGAPRNPQPHHGLIESLEPRQLLSKTVYVDLNSPGPARDGATWATAYIDLQQGLTAAASGDQIHVADGTYKPTSANDRTISFQLKSGVAIYGSYAGYGAASTDARDAANTPTVLSGDIGAGGNNLDNSYHVVVGSGAIATAVLDGITITAGNANATTTPFDFGGGIYDSSGSPTINNCTLSNNHATVTNAGGGGGMANLSSSSPVVSNCAFYDNSGPSIDGGGMYNDQSTPTVTNCIFSGNSAPNAKGGGVFDSTCSPTFVNCIFSHNSALQGGGMYNSSSSSPLVLNCAFNGNTAAASGGAVFNFNNSSIGAFSSPTFTNCAFVGNTTQSAEGGGMQNTSSASPVLTNCTFVGDSSGGFGGAMQNFINCSPKLANCVFWDNSGGSNQIVGVSTITVTYSDIQDGLPGTGNINADPQFLRNPSPGPDNTWGTADDDYGDIHLQSTSPCVDVGTNAAVPAGTTTDLGGYARIFHGIVDMGVYEFQPLNDSWTGLGDATNWNDRANWSNNHVPTQDDSVSVPSGFGTIHIIGGTYAVNSLATVSTIEIGTAALVLQNTSTFADGLTIDSGGKVQVANGATFVTVAGLSIAAGGALDLTDSDMIIKNASASDTFSLLSSGFNTSQGYWNGASGILSTTAAADSTHLRALGVMQSNADVSVIYTYYGDADLNGTLNGADYQQIDTGYGSHASGWAHGDFNYDGVIDGSDYALIDNTYNQLAALGLQPQSLLASPANTIAAPAIPLANAQFMNASVEEPVNSSGESLIQNVFAIESRIARDRKEVGFHNPRSV